MKKIAFLFTLVLTVAVVTAQNSKVQSALNYSKPQYNQLDKAQEAIELAVKHEKTMNVAKTWKVRGEVYERIATTKDDKFKTLSENPLGEAFKSYKKALELDTKGRYKNEIQNKLSVIGVLMINKGIEYFNTKDFPKALSSFENSLEVDAIVDPSKIDTTVIYNASIAADRGKNFDKAIKYYKQVADLKYEGSKVYGFIANIEKERGDTVAYVKALKEGVEAYPADNNVLMVELINYYLTKDESDKALGYLSKAIEKDPTNHTFHFAQGSLYDKLQDFDNAKKSYEKAVELKPDYFDAYYNLGALFFNKGVAILKEANNIPPSEQAKYDAEVKKSFAELEKALPYLEKAHEIDSLEKSTIITLKEIYFKLRNGKDEYMTKYKEFNEKVKNLPK